MSNKFRVSIIVFAVLTIFAGTADARESDFKQLTIVDNNIEKSLETTSETVRELLIERNIILDEKDKLNLDLDEPIEAGTSIEIDRGFYVNIVVENLPRSIKVENGTKVGNLLAILPSLENGEYLYDGLLTDTLKEDKTYNLKIKHIKTETLTEVINFETIHEDDNDMFVDTTEVHTEGREGSKEITYSVIYVDGKEIERNISDENIITEPINKVIKVGKKPKVVSVNTSLGDFEYSAVYTMRATAYTNGPSETGKSPGDKYYGITASGTTARYGAVAVDPRVIPLGTKLYIEGYGVATAEDTGGSIKGHRIDLFFNSYSECVNFGVRNIKVYVLK